MAFMAWDEKYQVNINIIDEQHKRLFTMIDNFHHSLRQKQTRKAMAEILQGLTEYSVYHFDTEESLMVLHQYPAHQEHHSAHDAFIKKTRDIRTRFEDGELVIPIEVAEFLKDWLSNHILVTDKKLAPYLQRKGVV